MYTGYHILPAVDQDSAAKRDNFRDITSRISAGFASGSWEKPILIGWGIADKYLPQTVAEEFQKVNPKVIKLKMIEGAGHMPQEDWPEKVIEALRFSSDAMKIMQLPKADKGFQCSIDFKDSCRS